MLDCLIDGLLDTLKLLPYLFITFIPNKMPYCYAIDKANQVYNKYEEFFILREREVK